MQILPLSFKLSNAFYLFSEYEALYKTTKILTKAAFKGDTRGPQQNFRQVDAGVNYLGLGSYLLNRITK